MKRDRILRQWLERFLSWLRRWGRHHDQPRVLESYKTDAAILDRLDCEQPGVVALWRIIHRDARRNLLVSLVSLTQIREDLALHRQVDCAIPSFRDWQRQLAASSPHAAGSAAEIAASHVVIVVWSSRKRFRQVVQGRETFVHRVVTQAVVFADLEGISRYWSPRNAHAIQVVKLLLLWLLERRLPLMTWEEMAVAMNWHDRLEAVAKSVFGESHELQPLVKKSPRMQSRPRSQRFSNEQS